MKYMRVLFALLLSIAAVAVFAQALPVPRVVFPLSTVGNVATVGAVTADAANAAKFSFGVAANGSVFANSGASLPTAGGKSIPLAVVGSVPKAAVGAALARFVGRALPLLNTASALYQLGEELGYKIDNSSGALSVKTQQLVPGNSSTSCTISPCYAYKVGDYPVGIPTAKSVTAAAQIYMDYYVSTYPGQIVSLGGAVNDATYRFEKPSGPFYMNITPYSVQPDTPVPDSYVFNESSPQAFLDAVANRSGWPSTSALARTLEDALKAGESVQVDPQAVTGPSSSLVTSTVTTNTVANTSTTTNTTNQYAYGPTTVTVTTNSTTVTVDNATGLPVSSSSTDTKPLIPDPVITCGLPDTPACRIDELDTPEPVKKDVYKSELDTFKTKHEELAAKVSGDSDKTFFSGWSSVFVTPPLAACTGYVLPRDMGTIDPCPVVDGVRTIMAYIWALTALFLAVGMIKKVV